MNKLDKNKLKEILMDLAKDEIRINYIKAKESLSIYSSKIGGKPAVPSDFVWPRYRGESFDNVIKERPLSFMAQINLEEINCYDTSNLLPKTGILSFFYEQLSMPWGFAPEDSGSAKVYYFPEKDKLIAMDEPIDMDEEAIIPEFTLKFEKHISIPAFEDLSKETIDIEFEWEDYEECCNNCGYFFDELGEVTKLLGYPDTIQSSMEEECESLMRGFRRGCPEDFDAIPKNLKEDIREKSKDWLLLFQMGTIKNDDVEYMFGDCGHIYFWIRKQDLKNHNFNNIWLILQCG